MIYLLRIKYKLVDINDGSLDYEYHFMVKKVTNDIETLNLILVSHKMMIFINSVTKQTSIYRPYALNSGRFYHVLRHTSVVKCNIYQLTNEYVDYQAWPSYDEAKSS